MSVCTLVFKENDPLSMVPTEMRKIILESVNDLPNDKYMRRIMRYTMTLQYIFTNGTFNTVSDIKGRIPKKGFFSMRQSKANSWYENYVNTQLNNLGHVLKKSNSDLTLGTQFITWSAVFYLEKAYPKRYKQTDADTNNYVYKIVKELISYAK